MRPTRVGSAQARSERRKGGVFKRLIRRVKSAFSFRRTGRIAPVYAPPSAIDTGKREEGILLAAADADAHTPVYGSRTLTEASSSDCSPSFSSPVKLMQTVGGAGSPASAAMSPETAAPLKPATPTPAATAAAAPSSTAPATPSDPFFRQACEIFGPSFEAELTSAKWSDRQQLLKRIASVITGGVASVDTITERLNLLSCVCELVARCMDDRVIPVVRAALDLWWSYITSDLCGLGSASTRGSVPLSGLVPLLLSKMSEKNQRTSRDARKGLLSMTRNRGVGGFQVVSPFLLDSSLPLLPRLDLLAEIIPEFKFKKGSCLNVASVLCVAIPALAIAHDITRRTAIDVVVACYKVVGKRVQGHLKDVKPVMLKILNRRFNEVDGVAPSRRSENPRRHKLAPLSRSPSRSSSAYLPTLSLASPSHRAAFSRPELSAKDSNVLPSVGGSSQRFFDANDEALMNSILEQPL